MGNISDKQKFCASLFIVTALAIIVIYFSSCTSCSNPDESSESYVQEYTGNIPNYRTCTNSYRLYVDQADDDYTYPRDRCKFCKGYNNYSYETFEDTTTFNPCPHNCKKYGVAQCDQGKIM